MKAWQNVFAVECVVERFDVKTAVYARLEAIAEAFNLTNRVNVVTRNATFGSGAYPTNPSPTFRQITAVAEPRSFQLGLRMKF